MDTAYPSVACPEAMTQFTQLSQGPVSYGHSNKEEDHLDDISLDPSISNRPKYKYCSSITKTVERTKVEVFDLTNCSNEDGPKKRN